jgi:Na+-driven multidrug efflux pump
MIMVMNASFNGLGKPMPAVVVSVFRIAVLYVPLAVIGMQLFAVPGIFAAYAVANVVSGIVAYLWARKTVRQSCLAYADAPT